MSSPAVVTSPSASGVKSSRSRRRPKEPTRTPFDDDPTWKLFITTNSQIKAWDQTTCETIFKSSSHGIVAAKRARDGSTVAIADAQVVMLHNYKEAQDKTYRLKGTQRCRLLQYSRDSRDLFFTDALHNSVQAYRLSKKTVSEATAAHPSPIICFAVSCDSNLIVSASAKPPVIHVHNQMHATTMSLAPSASAAAVVSCAFHPTRKTVFVLAFGDGVLAAYDYNSMSKSKTKKTDTAYSVPRCTPKAIHAFQHLHDPSIKGSAGITGVEFLPGHGSRAITVGEDGRCFLVDFEQRSTVGSWHIGAPATCLAIREAVHGTESQKAELGNFLLAVGTVHGRCIVYDGNANKIAEKVIEKDGEPVLDIEWVNGSVDIPDHILSPAESRIASSDTEMPSDPKNPSGVRGLFSHGHNPSISIPSPLHETDGNAPDAEERPPPGHTGSTKRKDLYEDLADTAEQGYMTLFSPVKKKRISKPASLPEQDGKEVRGSRTRVPAADKQDQRSVISAPLLWNENVGDQLASDVNKADKPSRDVFGVFNNPNSPTKESPSQSQSDHSLNMLVMSTGSVVGPPAQVQSQTTDGKLLNEIRSVRANIESSRAARGSNTLATIAPYLPSRIRSVPTRKTGKDDSGDRSHVSAPAAANERSNSGPATSSTQGSGSVQVKSGRSMVKDAAGDERTGDELGSQSLDEDVADNTYNAAKTKQQQGEDGGSGEDEDIWLVETLPDLPKPASSIGTKSADTHAPLPPSAPSSFTSDARNPTRHISRRSERTSRSVAWSASPPQTIQPPSSNLSSHPPRTAPAPPSSHITTSALSSVEPQNLDLISAITALQHALSSQMSDFREEVQRQFMEQNREILQLRQEVGRLWNENHGLREALEDAGVVESAGDTAPGRLSRRGSMMR